MGRILVALLLDIAILATRPISRSSIASCRRFHDITTNPIDPPRFRCAGAAACRRRAKPRGLRRLYSAEQQHTAYPDIEPVTLEATPQKAFDEVLKIVNKRKWLIIDERAPQPPRLVGPHRGGGAHADHGLSRGDVLDPGAAGHGRAPASTSAPRHVISSTTSAPMRQESAS